ncbi:phage tail tape measure protein [Aquipuribacter sp. SD81]|uniref:phage tail tape measure protein n=1 Tax=Aquipuribacter sp. SD81 TaxID=3127703 RepID=UPI00301AC691
MADRTVLIRLMANVSEYVRAMRTAEKSTEDVGKKTEDAEKRSRGAMSRLAQHAHDNEKAWTDTGKAFLGVGLAAGAGLTATAVAFSRFDAEMSQVRAATGATGKTLDDLREAAIQAGADTAFSATEAAAGITELSKAGVSAADILDGGLDGALALASAGGLEVADAAGIAATALTQFKLEGQDVTHVADLLAAGAGKAQGDVSDLGQALGQSGLVAEQTGLTIEETTGALTAFASAGLLGSDAGTSFKSMLQRLTPQSAEARDLMNELGISAYDAGGEFVGLEAFAGNLRDSLADLTPEQRNSALATIFGSDAVRAASVIYQQGAEGIATWTRAVDDQGFAAEQAAAKMDNLRGDAEEFLGSVETSLIGLGEASNGPLREATQDATTLVNVFGDMPDGAQQAVTAVGLVTAGVGLLGGGLLITIPRLEAGVVSLAKMGPAGHAAAGGLRAAGRAAGPIGLALAGLSTVGYVLIDSWVDQKQAVDDYASSLDELTGAVTDASRTVAAKALEDRGALEAAERLGVSTSDLVTAITEGGQAYEDVTERINRMSEANAALNEAQMATSGMNNQTEADLERLRDVLGQQSAALGDAQEQTRRLAAAEEVAAGTVSKAAAEYYEARGGIDAMTEAAAGAAGAIDPMTGAIADSGEQADTAADRLEEWRRSMAGIAEAFVEPLSAYQQLLADKEEAERQAAEATAAATEDAEDSWQDYYEGVSLTLTEYADMLEQQIADQEQWRANLVTVTERGGLEVAGILADMGAEGAQITADMADATDAEFQRMADLLIADAQFGREGVVAELEVMERLGRKGAKNTAEGIAEELGIGAEEVRRIADKYGIALVSGVNPVLSAVGKTPIRFDDTKRANGYATGGVMPGWSPGRDVHQFYSATGGRLDLSGGEAVMRPEWTKAVGTDYVARANAAARSGRPIPEVYEAYATGGVIAGGFTTASSVPKPYSTDPFRTPLSTGAQATMGAAYAAVTKWLAANVPAGGDLVSIGKWLQSKGARVSGHPAFGGVTPGAHSPTSLHYRNRAIDVNYGPGGANSIENAFVRGILPTVLKMASFRQVYYREIGGRTDHDDHLHLGLARGGVVPERGSLLNPHVRDAGGPLLPGFTYNGTGKPETVIPTTPATAVGVGGAVTINRNVNVQTDGTELAGRVVREALRAEREIAALGAAWGVGL